MQNRTRTSAVIAAATLASGLAVGSAQAEAVTPGSAPDTAASQAAVGTTAVVVSDSKDSSQARLQVVDPDGGVIRTLGTIHPDSSVADISTDGGTIVTSLQQGGATTFTVWQDGDATSFSVQGQARAHLAATGVITTTEGEDPGPLTLRDRSGKVVKELPELPRDGAAEVSPGGTMVMQASGGGIALRRATDGTVVRTVKTPEGHTSCTPLGLWGQDAKMTCSGDGLGGSQVFVARADGAVVPVTYDGYSNAWPTSAERTVVPEDGAGSRVGALFEEGFENYFPKRPDTTVTAAEGSRLWVHGSEGVLAKYDIASKATQVIGGPGSPSGGYVHDARSVDPAL